MFKLGDKVQLNDEGHAALGANAHWFNGICEVVDNTNLTIGSPLAIRAPSRAIICLGPKMDLSLLWFELVDTIDFEQEWV